MWSKLFPRYGNWGGPKWSGGAFPKTPEDTDWSVPGIDSMDDLFKEHDRGYQKAIKEHSAGISDADGLDSDWEAADDALVNGLGNLPADPRKWPRASPCWCYAWGYRKLAVWAFWTRLKLWWRE